MYKDKVEVIYEIDWHISVDADEHHRAVASRYGVIVIVNRNRLQFFK